MALPTLVQAGLTTIEAASGQLLSSTPGSDNTILLLVKNTGAGAPSGVVDGNGNTLALAYSYTAGYGDLFLYYRHTGGSEDADSRTFTVTGTVDAMGAIELAGKIQPVSPGNSVGANNGNPRTLNLTNLDAGNLSIVMGGCYYGANGSLPDYTEWRDSSSAEEWTYLAGYEATATGSFSRAITLGTVAAGAFFVSVAATEWEHVAGGGSPATLSSPTGAQTGTTTATAGATTDTGSGTLYAVVTTSATPPTATQVKNGQNAAGVSAPAAGNVAVSSTGAKTVSLTGLSPATTYYAHLAQETTGGLSNVVSSASFVTAAVNNLAAAGTAQATGTATLLKGVSLAGSGLSVATGTGDLRLSVPLAATGLAVAAGSAGLQLTIQLQAAAVAQAVGTASLALAKQLAAVGQAQATGTAALQVGGGSTVNLAAAGQAQVTGTATLSLVIHLQAAAVAQALGLAGLAVSKQLGAAGQALASGGAALWLDIPLNAAGLAQAAGAAGLQLLINLPASGLVQATGSAQLQLAMTLQADGQAVATGTAGLSVLLGLDGVRGLVAPVRSRNWSGEPTRRVWARARRPRTFAPQITARSWSGRRSTRTWTA